MKLSVIISSYNQKKRLQRCLESAMHLKTVFADSIEIIVADDNSNDGSRELIEEYSQIKLSTNDNSKTDTYTLAENWNHAVLNHATGDRVIFTNGDHRFTPRFADHHADPNMENDIIFGPAYQSTPQSLRYIEDEDIGYIDLVKKLEKKKMLTPDRHAEGSAMTYNREWQYWFPFGYNFSVKVDHFKAVGGFPPVRKWGGEEALLCKRIIDEFSDVKIKSNCNTIAIHQFHPVVNHEGLYGGDNYRF